MQVDLKLTQKASDHPINEKKIKDLKKHQKSEQVAILIVIAPVKNLMWVDESTYMLDKIGENDNFCTPPLNLYEKLSLKSTRACILHRCSTKICVKLPKHTLLSITDPSI
uniref:Uncharacterized protein n=1 Tax=Romanomermis culicivorax TaxID=13658 RepID=A0A915KMP9_ROMCU